MADTALALLAAVGLAIAARFSLAALPRPARWRSAKIADACQPPAASCVSLLDAPQARLLGLPNGVYGVAYYSLLLIGLPLGWWRAGAVTLGAAVAVAWGTVALGAYLTYALLRILHVPCRLCLLSHALNLVLALLMSARWWAGS